MANKRKKLKIVNKTRFTIFCLSMAGLFSLGVSSAVNFAGANSRPETLAVYVQPGDTLWDIARTNNPGGRDLRRLVRDIRLINGLDSAVIQAGDRLEIPLS